MKAKLLHFFKSTCGATMVEFAVILPVMLSLLIGVVEISTYVFAFNKTEKTASSLAAIIARGDLTAAALDDLLKATDPLMTPFNFTASNNGVIVTMWRANAISGTPEVLWTRSYRTPGTAMTPTTLASKITLDKTTGETVMTIEVFYKFIPMLVGAVFPSGTADVYSAAFAFPRDGSMDTLP